MELWLMQADAPWFDPNTTGIWIGVIAGGGGGTLAGILGGLTGWLAPKGKGRRFVLGSMITLMVLGGILLVAGILALASGQPYGVWYPLTLPGLLFVVIEGALFPVVRRRYAEAESRRLEAASLRDTAPAG